MTPKACRWRPAMNPNYRVSITNSQRNKPTASNNGIGDWTRNANYPAREHPGAGACSATHNNRGKSPRGANLIASITHYATSHQHRENGMGTAGCPDYPFPVAIGSHTDAGRMIPAMNARAGGEKGTRAINIGLISFGPEAARLTPVGWCQ